MFTEKGRLQNCAYNMTTIAWVERQQEFSRIWLILDGQIWGVYFPFLWNITLLI